MHTAMHEAVGGPLLSTNTDYRALQLSTVAGSSPRRQAAANRPAEGFLVPSIPPLIPG
jgi:hypothetical protein